MLREIGFVVLLSAAVGATGAVAANRQPLRPPTTSLHPTVGPNSPVAAVPLTKAECKGLGGKVKYVVDTVCASGSKCVTVDENNVIHAACIDKK